MKKGDYVVAKLMPGEPSGVIIRVARDGTWVDVRWRHEWSEWASWSKRMRTEALQVIRRQDE